MANNWQIDMIAGLDPNQSRAKINGQINKLKGQLKDISLTAKIDPKIASDIQKQLTNLQVSLTNVKISDKALNDMVSQINNALQGIKIPNINIGGNGNQQFVNNITNGFKQSANAIEAFKNSLSNAGESSSEIDNIVKKVQALNVQIDSLRFSESTNGTMNVNVAGLDEFGNKVRITQTLLQDLQNMQQWNVTNTTTSVISTKELERINNAFTDYTAKLAQFKSTNTNILSGLTQPLADFESKLAGLKNGTVTIDEVKNAFKLLGTEASKITENFTGQLSKTDAAIRKLAQGDEIMDKLKASFKGLNNAPKEITKELNSVSKLLQNVKNIESTEGRTANWSAEYRKWSDEVDKLQAKLSVLQKQQANMTTPQIFKTSELRDAGVAYMTKVSNTIEKQMVEIQKMANAKGWQKFEVKGVEETDGKINALTLTVRDAEGALKQFTMQRAKLQGSGKAQTGLMQVGDVKVLETASQAQEKLAQSTEKANAKLAEQANKIQLSYANGDYEAKVESTIAKTQQWRDENGNARISTEQLRTALANLGAAYNKLNVDGGDTIANQKALKQAESELSSEIKRVTNEVTKMNAEYAKSSKVESFHQKLTEFYDKNTATHSKWGAVLKQMMDATASGAKVANSELIKMEHRYEQIGNKARQTGKLGLSFFDGIKEQAKKFTQWVSVTSVVMESVQAIKQLISVSKELDTVMTDFTMATGTTGSQLESLTESYSKLANKLKSTTTDVMTSATEWIKQGQSIADTEILVSNSMILSKIGKLDSANATKYLTSAMKGYKVSVDDTLSVVDKLSAVDMASATDVGGLAEGMSEVAASADLAGVSMDKLLGYLAAIGETTQSGMSEVGTTLNAVFSRMGNIKLSRLKNYDNNGEDLSNVETVLRGVGISLRDSANSFRDFDKVLDETASNWNNYSEVQQRAIASAFAG